jgi:hypothetical protein
MDEIGDFAPSETGGFITVSSSQPLALLTNLLTSKKGPSNPTQEIRPSQGCRRRASMNHVLKTKDLAGVHAGEFQKCFQLPKAGGAFTVLSVRG